MIIPISILDIKNTKKNFRTVCRTIHVYTYLLQVITMIAPTLNIVFEDV